MVVRAVATGNSALHLAQDRDSILASNSQHCVSASCRRAQSRVEACWRTCIAVPVGSRARRRPVQGYRARSSARQGVLVQASLGFSAEPRIGVERAAKNLLKDAASLLIYQAVLLNAPGQAFLKLLLQLHRSDDGVKLLQSYGEFFRSMALAGGGSWEDYVLERILSGEDNAFAEAAAASGTSGPTPPNLLSAAAADLDALQRLAVTEATLSSWVAEVVEVRAEWRVAASRGGYQPSGSQPPPPNRASARATRLGFGVGFSVSGEVVGEEEGPGVPPPRETVTDRLNGGSSASTSGGGDSARGAQGALDAERGVWRRRVGGLWRWSEAVPLLQDYHSQHSTGLPSTALRLSWRGGKLEAASAGHSQSKDTELSVQAGIREELMRTLRSHAEGHPAHHTLLFGPSGGGKSYTLQATANEVSETSQLRTVWVPRGELKGLEKLIEVLGRHPPLRFALLLDDAAFRPNDDQALQLKGLLDGTLHPWPVNVLLVATSPRRDLTRTPPETFDASGGSSSGGALGQLFGSALYFQPLTEEMYLGVVRELAAAAGVLEFSEGVAEKAKQWAHSRHATSVLAAKQFVHTLSAHR